MRHINRKSYLTSAALALVLAPLPAIAQANLTEGEGPSGVVDGDVRLTPLNAETTQPHSN